MRPYTVARVVAGAIAAILCPLIAAGVAHADDTPILAAPTDVPAAVESSTPVASPAPDADKILVSVPDAGGLRITVKPSNQLHIFVAGHDLPDVPALPIVAFTADSAGYVNGGSATLNAAHQLTNLFGTGLDVKVLAGTKLTATTNGITLDKSGGTGGVSLVLPLKDSTGKKTEIDIAPLNIQRDGTIRINASVTRTTNVKVPGGISLSAQSLAVDYAHTPGSDDDDVKITLGNVSITAPIPGVLTQNPAPLTLSVASASVNSDGQVSFDGAKLSQTALGPTAPLRVASARPIAAAARKAGFPLRIPLMKPADFVIVVNKADDVTLSMQNNVPSAISITCDIELPSIFTATPGGTDRVSAKGVTLSVGTANGFSATVNDLPTAYFKGFGVKVHSATLDLSETTSPAGAPSGAAWEGIFFQDAELIPPPSVTFSDGTATPPKLTLTGNDKDGKPKYAWIDNNGFTGKVALTNGSVTVEEFALQLKNVDVQVQRNSVKAFDISGTLTVVDLGSTPIDVDASVTDSGMASLHVKTGKITIPDFPVEMELQNGTFQRKTDASGHIVAVLNLSGNLKFTEDAPEAVQGLAVQVKDLMIDSRGKFTLDSVWIDLPQDSTLDFDIVTVDVQKIGFGGISNDPNQPSNGKDNHGFWIGFTGQVGIGGDLPIQASADFDGLKIYKDYVHVGRVGVTCDIEDVIHVDGYIEQTEGMLTRSVIVGRDGHVTSNINPDPQHGGVFLDPNQQVDPSKLKLSDGKPLTMLSGRVKISLPILGGGDGDSGPGGAIEFLIARNCWFAMGSFGSTSPLITLGNTGLAIYGFGGGIGYNITSETANPTGIPDRDYQVIPDIAAIEGTKPSTGLPNILVLASVRLGNISAPPAPPPLWGDITLVVDLASKVVSLNGACYVAEVMPTDIPAISDNLSRVLSARLSYDFGTNTFVASGQADFAIPKKEYVSDGQNGYKKDSQGNPIDNSLVRLHAPFAFKIGVFDQGNDAGFAPDNNNRVFYAKLGGPVDLGAETTRNGVTAHRNVSITNPVTVKIRGLDPIQGAMTLDINKGEFCAALKFHEGFSVDSGGRQSYDVTVADTHVATIKYRYSLSGQFDTIGWLTVKFPGYNDLHGSGNQSQVSLGLDSVDAKGEFYVNAQLNGSATDLNVNPAIFPSFNVPDISLTAVLEADLSGEISATQVSIHGQVYADLGFSVGGFSLSLPFSKDIAWTY